jgi:hypothetical protein
MNTVALKLPVSYVGIEQDEMEYIDGGMSAKDMALNLLIGAVGSVIGSKLAPYCTLAVFKAALSYCSGAAAVVWTAVANAVAWVWNTPVALACLGVAVGAAVGIMGTYCWYKYHVRK